MSANAPEMFRKAALFKPISFNCARSSVQEAAFQKHALFDMLICYMLFNWFVPDEGTIKMDSGNKMVILPFRPCRHSTPFSLQSFADIKKYLIAVHSVC